MGEEINTTVESQQKALIDMHLFQDSVWLTVALCVAMAIGLILGWFARGNAHRRAERELLFDPPLRNDRFKI